MHSNNRQWLLAAAATAAMLIGTAAHASLALEEIVVTAQKREQPLQEVPISIDVVTASTLERRAITDSRTLAQAAPSLNFQDGFAPQGVNFSIRGLTSRTFEGGLQPSVSLTVDGVTYARNGEFIFELADVERVEVLRGPQGTLFGRNAIGGAINITTKRPGDEFEGYADLSATTDDELLYRISLSGPLSETVGGSLIAYYKDRDGYIENIFPGAPDYGNEETSGARAKLDIDVSDTLNVLFTADYYDSTNGLGQQILTAPENDLRITIQGNGDLELGRRVIADRTVVNTNDDLGDDNEYQSLGFSADLTWELGDQMRLKAITGYRDWEGSSTIDIDGGPGNVTNRMGIQTADGVNNYTNNAFPAQVETNLNRIPGGDNNAVTYEYISQEIRLEGSTDNIAWTAGFYYQDLEEGQATDIEFYFPASILFGGGPGVFFQSIDNKAEVEAMALFADATFQATDTLDLFAGFRWTTEDNTNTYDNIRVLSPDAGGGNAYGDDPNANHVTIDITKAVCSATGLTNAAGMPCGTPGDSLVSGEISDDNNDWSGRLGLSWQFSEAVNLYSSISRSFIGFGANIGRSDVFAETNPAPAFVEPTTATSFEIGIKSRPTDSLQLNAAAFILEAEDLQTTDILPDTTTVAINAGDLDILGVEADLLWSLNEQMRLTAGLVYLDAEVKNLILDCYFGQIGVVSGCSFDPQLGIQGEADASGNRPPNTPEFKYNIALDFDLPFTSMPFDGYGNISYVWQDDVFFDYNNNPLLAQDSYGTLDISVGIAERQGRYDLSLFGKNVTDKEFIGDASAGFGSFGRATVRIGRNAQAYYGARLCYNF